MKRISRVGFFLIVILLSQSCSMEKLYRMGQKRKVSPYEQFDFNSLMKRYYSKDKSSVGAIEGIYSVSSLITKKGKGLLSNTEKEKVVERKENYSKVAVIRDANSAEREYLEVPVSDVSMPSYSIRGEFTAMSDGNILVYKHFEPRGKTVTYTFAYDKARDILEGQRTENDGNFTVTYKLTYLKLYPKAGGDTAMN